MKQKLTESQRSYVDSCAITYLANKYIVQTPMGFHAGSYKTREEAISKVLGMAKFH
jgi:hypothetical protein